MPLAILAIALGARTEPGPAPPSRGRRWGEGPSRAALLGARARTAGTGSAVPERPGHAALATGEMPVSPRGLSGRWGERNS